VTKFVKLRRTRWLECLTCKTEMRDVQIILFGRLKGRDDRKTRKKWKVLELMS